MTTSFVSALAGAGVTVVAPCDRAATTTGVVAAGCLVSPVLDTTAIPPVASTPTLAPIPKSLSNAGKVSEEAFAADTDAPEAAASAAAPSTTLPASAAPSADQHAPSASGGGSMAIPARSAS